MNNKKVQAQMKINVSFLADITQLTKQLENATKKLDLSAGFSKNVADGLSKGFKEIYSNIDKMTEGLSKKGLSARQYTTFFNDINAKLQDSIKLTQGLRKSLNDAFNSQENKEGLKTLEQYKKQLEEINKLASAQKGSQTRQATSIQKLKDEFGIDYNISKKTLSEIYGRVSDKKGLTNKQQAWTANYNIDEAGLKRVVKLYEQIIAHQKTIRDANAKANASTEKGGVDASIEYLEKQIARLESQVITSEVYKENSALLGNIEEISNVLQKSGDDLLPKFNSELSRGTSEAEKLARASSTLKEIFGQFGITFTAATIVKAFTNLAKSSFDFYKSLDSALNEIYIVSSLSINQVNKLQSSFINMAKNTGMSIDDVTRSAVLFYQQGLNTDEVLEMTRVTSQFAKVAGIDATDAADKLTAAVNGYCLAASDAVSVADKFNQVAAASAADINELSTAFSKAAAQANQAGVSMDNYLAYIATMEEATREAPENIGTSLKTIFSRMQQIKTGENTEDSTDVNQVETALKSVNITLRDTQGQLRDLEEIFDELGPKWQTLDRNTQAYLGTIIAGTRQQSRFITLMQNWDRVQDLANQSANSAGRQALMHSKAMDSIESKLQQLSVAWQEFVSNLSSSSFFKTAISGLTSLLNLLNKGNKPLILLAGAVALLGKKFKEIQPAVGDKFKDMLSTLRKGAKGGRFTTEKEKQLALNKNEVDSIKNQTQLNLLKEKEKQIVQEIITLENSAKDPKKDDQQAEEDIKKKKEEQLAIQKEINDAEKTDAKLTKERKDIENSKVVNKRQRVGSGLEAAGMALGTLGMMSNDNTTAGILGGVGGIAMGVGQGLSGNVLGGIITGIIGAASLISAIGNAEKEAEKKLTDSVNKVSNKLNDVNNYNTSIKSTDQLIKKYETLSRKVNRTTSEQEELNSTVQELANTHDIEALSDSYGNLSINISEVNTKLDELKEKRMKAMKELDEQELKSLNDSYSGLLNDNKVGDYYDQLFKTNKSSYKNLLAGIDDELDDESRRISSNLAKTFSDNLKQSMVDELQINADKYLQAGFGESIVKMEEDLDAALSGADWNELYTEIDYLKNNVDSMTFQEVQNHLSNFYDTWNTKTELTQDQWDLLVDSINNTIFENKSLLNFYKEVNELQGKSTGTYYQDRRESLDEQLNIAKEDAMKSNMKYNAIESIGAYTASSGAFALANSWNPGGWAAWIVTAIGAAITVGGEIAKYNSDENKRVRAIENRIKELEKEEKESLQKIADEQGLFSTDDAKEWVDAQKKVVTTLQNLDNETQKYLNSLSSYRDFSGFVYGEDAQEYAKELDEMFKGLQGITNEGDRFNYLAQYYEDNKYAQSEVVTEKLQAIVDEAFSQLSRTAPKTFVQLGGELDSISKSLRSMNSIVEEFNENGAISLDTFMELGSILDNIDLESLGKMDNGTEYIDNMITALHNLDLAYDANNGMITMNGEALNSLRAIQEAQTKAKIASTIAELKASKASIETEIAYIDAQIDGAKAALAALEGMADGQVTYEEVVEEANKAATESFQGSLSNILTNYQNDVANNNTWKTAIINNLADVASAWNAYYTAIKNGSANVDELYKKAQSNTPTTWSGIDTTSGIDWGSREGKIKDVQGLRDQITDYISRLENTRAKTYKTLELTNAEISLMQNMYDSDLSALGTSADKNGSDIEQYIGKLQKIYNILNRIQNLEHRLSMLDTYADIAKGERYGELLQERLGYNEELLNQYDFLVREQKAFTNGYKDFIGTVEGLEGVFDFDEYGQIIINWEKYIALQDQAADGETTLKEKADDVYETYTSMYKELQDDASKYISYLKQVLALQQQMIDSYVTMESKAANAVKEIYKKILDTKLDAIDQEKEAIEDLRKAREDARKDQKDAKEVTGLQTNMQRAMMDTSGASDIAFIKAQNDITDKMEQIADDKYGKMLNNIVDQLEEEKSALQEEFDELWENMDWLYSWLDESIMLDDDRLKELLQQTDEWNTSSELQRNQLMQDWDTNYQTYMKGLTGDKSIYDVWDMMQQNRDRIDTMDQALQSSISQTGNQIAQTILGWQNGVNAAISSAVSSALAAAGGGGGRTTTVENYNQNPGSATGSTVTITLNDGFGHTETKKVNAGDSVTLPTKSQSGYKFVGWSIPSKNITSVGSYTYKPTKSETVTAEWASDGKPLVNTNTTTTNLYPGASFRSTDNLLNPDFSLNNVYKKVGRANGGAVSFTGPAYLHGTPSDPEYVLNALQTEHFIKFTNALDHLFGNGNPIGNASSVSIDNISFNVASMSSPEDGEAAFNMFVSKFKEIGAQTGIKMNSFKNTL